MKIIRSISEEHYSDIMEVYEDLEFNFEKKCTH